MNRRRRSVFTSLALVFTLLAASVFVSGPAVAGSLTCMGRAVTISGTGGNDVLRGTSGDDVIRAGRGNDIIYGLGGNDVICAGPGADRVYGGKGRDRIKGGSGNDIIRGGAGRDRLFGGSGQDILSGNAGIDRLSGGTGVDQCRSAARTSGCEDAITLSAANVMVARINVVRAAAGQGPLVLNPEISAVARAWSQYLADSGEFFHNPNYVQQYPSGFRSFAENIAYHSSALNAQTALENSSGHYANMISSRYTEIGIGIVIVNGRVYVTQNFAG
ncbi:MAG: CAP domain-containing protein [Acidimicrobiales bacterium]